MPKASPMESGDFVEPSADARRKLLALYFAAVLVAALLVFFVRPTLLGFIGSLPACERARWSLTLLAALLAPLPFVAAWVALHARRLIAVGQWPLPGAWVWRRTPVRRGRALRVQAYALMACATGLVAATLYGGYVLQPLFSALAQRCGA